MTGQSLRKPGRADWMRTAAMVGAAGAAIVAMGVWLGRAYPFAVGAGAAAILAVLVKRHAATTGYRCPGCGREFMISARADLLSPQMITTKYVRCPGCGRRAWMEALMREKPASM